MIRPLGVRYASMTNIGKRRGRRSVRGISRVCKPGAPWTTAGELDIRSASSRVGGRSACRRIVESITRSRPSAPSSTGSLYRRNILVPSPQLCLCAAFACASDGCTCQATRDPRCSDPFAPRIGRHRSQSADCCRHRGPVRI